MAVRDDKVRKEILKWLYDRFEEDPIRHSNGRKFLAEVDGLSEEEVVYNVERMDGELIDKEGALGTRIAWIHITPAGIEELQNHGHPTILEENFRYEILEQLYEADRKNPGFGMVERDDLIEGIGAEEVKVDQNIWYIKEKRLIETGGGGGGLFYHDAKITRRGTEAFETYRDDGVEIPQSKTARSLRQATIGPGERDKAENLFRDFVELAQEEVLIIDAYARKPLYGLLELVPEIVSIKVLTSKSGPFNPTSDDYVARVEEFAETYDVDVRYLDKEPDGDWDSHERYVIRDREDGWAWGHSFHDAGDTRHTPSEVKPVNLLNTLEDFDKLWERATPVILQ